MSSRTLTQEAAFGVLQDFFREKPLLFFGTGMSCALDSRFGMPALARALCDRVPESIQTPSQQAEWDAVVDALQRGSDLESAMNCVTDQGLLRIVTDETGRFLADIDRETAYKIAQGQTEWPARELVTRLVRGAPAGDPILQVITPNYDMLFEYDCESAGIPYTDGFFGGVECKQDWQAVTYAFLESKSVLHGRRVIRTVKHKAHVRLYKVHGSLNYFFHRDAVCANNSWMWDPPDFTQRVLITPGLTKYETLQRYRQELLQSADAAIENATHFLFLGYGFNDGHLEEYIRRKIVTQSSKALIVTKAANARIRDLLASASNLWLVCGTDGGTEISNTQYLDPLILPGSDLWDIRQFTKRILGG